MARILRNLRIDEVSSVDVGAGRGVKVVLTKRAATSLYNKPLVFGAQLDAETEAYLKREFSQSERDSAAESGAALPDGSFPIHSKADLKNAIQAIGRAKDPDKAKAHVKSRARALGASDMIPDTWKRAPAPAADVMAAIREQVAKNAIEFNDAYEMIECVEDAQELMGALYEACRALDCSLQSILADDEVADKPAAIAESYEQFKTHLDGLEAEDTEKRAMTDTTVTASKQVQDMIAKAVAEAIEKSNTEKDTVIAKLNEQLDIAKMSDKHKAYHDSLGSDAEKKKFRDMSPDDRDGAMDKAKKRAEDDPIYKRQQTEIDDLKKRLNTVTDERELDIAKRDAKELGMTQSDAGEILMKMRRGDPEAIKKFEAYTSGLAKSRTEIEKTGKIFAEFGTSRGSDNGADATAELMAKADELRKAKPELTEAQAFDKVYNDPANKELRERETRERMNKIHRVA